MDIQFKHTSVPVEITTNTHTSHVIEEGKKIDVNVIGNPHSSIPITMESKEIDVMIKQSSQNVNFVSQEIPSGLHDGVNISFNIAHLPIPGTFRLFLNGLRLVLGTEYTINGQTITMLEFITHLDILLVDYIY